MPEGHSVHRYARLHTEALAGRQVFATSPQGRFLDGAEEIDGRVLHRVSAHGKHLFYWWDHGRALHVHLGLFGLFRMHHGDEPSPSAGARLVLRAHQPDVAVHLSGPVACELLDPAEVDLLRARLGPDPLDPSADSSRFVADLARRSAPIGQVLLDQTVIAGVGNVFRAEVLFVCGIDPSTPARQVGTAQAKELWDALRQFLIEGERTGVIATAAEEAPPSADGTPPRFVYRRTGESCLRCGTPVRSWELGGRTMYACPACQPPTSAATRASGA